jgi:hypothetical protein
VSVIYYLVVCISLLLRRELALRDLATRQKRFDKKRGA